MKQSKKTSHSCILTALQLSFSAAALVFALILYLKFSSNPLLRERAEALLEEFGLTESALAGGILLPVLSVLLFWNILSGIRMAGELSRSRETLERLSGRDDLTGLDNRNTAMQSLPSLLGHPCTVCMVRIDCLTDLNEAYSSTFGDMVLRTCAERIDACVSPAGGYAARYSGSVFLVVLPGREDSRDDGMIRMLREKLHAPVRTTSAGVCPTATIGAAYAGEAVSPEEICVQADIALRSAMSGGRNAFTMFTGDLMDAAKQKVRIRMGVQSAIRSDGFFMVYQPKVDSRSCTLTGYEALVRMKNIPCSPSVFIPIAEENGLLIEIGRITTEKTIRQIGQWLREGRTVMPVSINFSSVQIEDAGYFDFLMDLLDSCHVPASLVEIEITERTLLRNQKETIELLGRFQKAGIRLLMDDFGTGYSSLSYLGRFPFDTIKIDKSFLDTSIQKQESRCMMRDLIQMGHDLGKTIVVEGVETSQQFSCMQEMQADEIQGYYFSRPLLPEEAIRFRPSKNQKQAAGSC